jgi:hypothetical protein
MVPDEPVRAVLKLVVPTIPRFIGVSTCTWSKGASPGVAHSGLDYLSPLAYEKRYGFASCDPKSKTVYRIGPTPAGNGTCFTNRKPVGVSEREAQALINICTPWRCGARRQPGKQGRHFTGGRAVDDCGQRNHSPRNAQGGCERSHVRLPALGQPARQGQNDAPTPNPRLGMISANQLPAACGTRPPNSRAMPDMDVNATFRRVQRNCIHNPGRAQAENLRIQVRVFHRRPPGRTILFDVILDHAGWCASAVWVSGRLRAYT